MTRRSDAPEKNTVEEDFAVTQTYLGDESGTATASVSDGNLVLEGSGDFDYLLTKLPLYDSEGYLYTYYIKEISCSVTAADEKSLNYTFKDLTYDDPVDAPKTATLLNVHTGNGGIEIPFEVEKVWNDDGDAEHRGSVRLQLIYTKPATQEPEVVATLGMNPYAISTFSLTPETGSTDIYVIDEDTQWWGLIRHYVSSDELDDDPGRGERKNYHIKELSIDRFTPNQSGIIQTDEHYYTVGYVTGLTGRVSGADSLTRIINTRVGDVTVNVTKNWYLGDLMMKVPNLTGLEAVFDVYANGVKINASNYTQYFYTTRDAEGNVIANPVTEDSISIHVPYTANVEVQGTGSTGPLRKYDDQGCLINYTVEESKILYNLTVRMCISPLSVLQALRNTRWANSTPMTRSAATLPTCWHPAKTCLSTRYGAIPATSNVLISS